MVHAPPGAPQLASDTGRQTFPSQHPEGHEIGSHTQTPLEHRCPGPQEGPSPQLQVPLAPHPSATIESHATQVAPPIPQVAMLRRRQSVRSQHPLGHEMSSHTQRPTSHRCPGLHGDPSPQAHSPATHESARIASQGRHSSAADPHALMLPGLQTAPAQQPSGQLVGSQLEHRPAMHSSSTGHALHSSPPVPHELGVVPGKQASPSQHPSGHEAPSQTHRPASQRWPAAQTSPAPQPSMQIDGPTGTLVHTQPSSTSQASEQPSPTSRFPSSHPSRRATTTPSPQLGGSPRWTSRRRISAETSVPLAAPAATTVPPNRPSTRAIKVDPARASGRITIKLSPSGDRERESFGRTSGANWGSPSTRPLKRSWSSSTSYVVTISTPVRPDWTLPVQLVIARPKIAMSERSSRNETLIAHPERRGFPGEEIPDRGGRRRW